MAKPTLEERGEDVARSLAELQDAARAFATEIAAGNYFASPTARLASAALRYAREIRRAIRNPTGGVR